MRPELPPLSSTSVVSMADLRGDSSSRAVYQFSVDHPLISSVSRSDLADMMSSKRENHKRFQSETVIMALPQRGDTSNPSTRGVHLHDATANNKSCGNGSLREDLEPVKLFSGAYAALAFSGFAAGFCITFLRYAFRPLLVAYLSLHHKNQFASARYLLEWPSALGVFVGLWSDCVALGGYRRKSFMVLGWVTSFLMFTGVVVVTLLSPTKIMLFDDGTKRGEAVATSDLETYPAQFAVLYVTFGVLGALGLEVAWMVSLALTVELAQREPLYVRGQLQASYMLLFYVAALLAQIIVSRILFLSDNDDEPMRSAIAMGEAGVVLSMCSVLTFPVVLFCLKEKRVPVVIPDDEENSSSRDGPQQEHLPISSLQLVQERIQELFVFCQQQVVYRFVFFICGIILVLGLYNQNLRDAMATWSGITSQKALDVQVAQNTCIVLGIALWRAMLVDTSWQKLVVVGVCFYVLCCVLLAMPTVYGWVRNEWFFMVLTALLELPKGWLKLYSVLPATEIAEVGREGVTVGLIFSFQWLVYIAANTVSTMLSRVIGTNVTQAQVVTDSPDTRTAVFTAAAVYYMINLCSVMLAPMLPDQKVAAQQMRVYGGRSKAMGRVIIVSFVFFLFYGLVANILVIQSSSD
ncbi:Transmembrane protein [Globisporangium polare]